MNKYEKIFNSIQSKYDNGEITLEQANELNGIAFNKYGKEKPVNMFEDALDIAVNHMVDDQYIVLEGANLDTRDELKKINENYKEHMKDIKDHIKHKEYLRAIASCKLLEKDIDDAADKINKIDGSVGSTIISWFTSWTINLGEDILLTLAACPTLGLTALYSSVRSIVDMLYKLVNDIKEDDVSIDSFNMYKSTVLNKLYIMKSCVKKLEAKAKKKMEAKEDKDD